MTSIAGDKVGVAGVDVGLGKGVGKGLYKGRGKNGQILCQHKISRLFFDKRNLTTRLLLKHFKYSPSGDSTILKSKVLRRSILGTIFLAVGILLEAFLPIATYNILSKFAQLPNWQDAMKLLLLVFGGGIICIGTGVNLLRERRKETSETEKKMKETKEKIKTSIDEGLDKLRGQTVENLRNLRTLIGGVLVALVFVFGVTLLIGGSISLVVYALRSDVFFPLLAGTVCLPSGVLALNGFWCFYKRRNKRGVVSVLVALVVFLAFLYLAFQLESL